MQTVKILGIQGSRKLKKYRSKNLVLLLDSGGKTNLETYIQGEYLSPSESGRTLSLSATDTIDTISATAQAIASLSFNTNDIIDTTEQNIEVIVSQSLNVTDSKDTAEIESNSIIAISIQSTDQKDVSNITAIVDISATLEATEAQDRAKIYISGTEKKKVQGTYLDPLLYKLFLRRSIKLNTKENKDVAIFQSEHIEEIFFNAKERTDRIYASLNVASVSQFAIYENTSDTMYSNKEEHDRIVLDRYNQYEQDQILAILSAA